ncbi:MAG: phosphotransferase [Pseudonocardia sp.]|nr:phosphotransferase [Pseudonocardia sp.]
MASPSWWGADSRRWSVRSAEPDARAGTAAFVKVTLPHARGYVDVPAAFAAARAAGDAGIGPRVSVSDPALGLLVMEDLTGIAATATLDRFDDLAEVERLVALRRRVHDLPGITRRASVFDDLRAVVRLARAAGAALPADLGPMCRRLAPAEGRIAAAGVDLVPCHGDGNVSNVLVTADGLLLVDWDSAGLMDPLQDLGVLLAELRPSGAGSRDTEEVFELAHGSLDASSFARARVYGIADQLRRAVIGLYADAVRPGTLDYVKFANWQLVHARAGLRDVRLPELVRAL